MDRFLNQGIGHLKQALVVASVVGTLLLLINQFDGVFGNEEIRWIPALLTYCVPFSVFLLGRMKVPPKKAN